MYYLDKNVRYSRTYCIFFTFISVDCPCSNELKEEHFRKMREELSSRVGVLEKWKWLIVGGSIVAGFIIQKVITINL